MCVLLALAVVQASVYLLLHFLLHVLIVPCCDATFVLPLPLPLKFCLVEEVVTPTLDYRMLSLDALTKHFLTKGQAAYLLAHLEI
jgi:hypothetical protein